MRVTVTTVGLDAWQRTLAAAPAAAHTNLVKAVQVNLHRARDTARGIVSGIAHAPHYPGAITYDVEDRGVGAGALGELGPDKERTQGPLGHIFEYGIPQTPPIPHLSPAVDAHADDLDTGLAIAGATALEA